MSGLNDLAIRSLRYSDLAKFVQIIQSALFDDPLFQHVFTGDTQQRRGGLKQLQRFYQFIFFYGRLLGYHFYGYEKDRELVGIMIIEPPTLSLIRSALASAITAPYALLLPLLTSPRTLIFFLRYISVITKATPFRPSWCLTLIAIDKKFQGQGIGGKLIRFHCDIADQCTVGVGTVLDTENLVNIPLYEHFGFEATGTHDVCGISVFTMYRKSKGNEIAT